MSLIFADKYKIINKIGEGSFGTIFSGLNINSNESVAIKIDELTDRIVLKNEARIYNYLSGISGIPKLYNFGNQGKYNYLIIELLGHSIEHYRVLCDGTFNLQTVLVLGLQMIKRIECVHNMGIIHRDVKPDNFLMGIEKNSHTLYLIDFGLSKLFMNDNKHIEECCDRKIIGTTLYASINIHNGLSPSRRDDLESIGYTLVYLLTGILPWSNITEETKELKNIKIGEIKKTYNFWNNKDIPGEFIIFINYTRTLKYEETPDYLYLKNLLLILYKHHNFNADNNYMWM